MKILSLRENPSCLAMAITYFQHQWATEKTRMLYEDCLTHALTAPGPLPQWYLLEEADEIIGCAGLITNDFISRMDLYPWLCALYIDEAHRGRRLGALLMEKAKADAKKGGFSHLYLCTDHVGYYEKFGFSDLGMGWQPWGDALRIDSCAV